MRAPAARCDDVTVLTLGVVRCHGKQFIRDEVGERAEDGDAAVEGGNAVTELGQVEARRQPDEEHGVWHVVRHDDQRQRQAADGVRIAAVTT